MKKTIISSNSLDGFIVFDNGAGIGKTSTFIDSMVTLFKTNPSVKTLFVQKFRDDGLNSISARINNKAGKEIAIGIDSSNYEDIKKKIKDYNVAIITHKMYKQLSLNKQKYKIITQGRNVLVIDEELDVAGVIVMNEDTLDKCPAIIKL